MKIALISSDGGLRKLCGEVLNSVGGPDWQLEMTAPEKCPAEADFYIWDSPESIDAGHALKQPLSQQLFLVQRSEIAGFSQNLGSLEANILLKPVTRASLSAFLGMAASVAQERQFHATTLRAERDEMLQCLIQSNLKLQEYDQDRTNFLARAVHDFRAPLTATCGYCGLLLSEALGPLNDDQKEVLRRMQHSSQRLSRMAAGMFELSVGRQMKRPLDVREADIQDCVDQALHEVNPALTGKRITVSLDMEAAAGQLYVEPGQIEQVFLNLLDNACKFTPQGGEIEIRGYPYFWERRSPHQAGAREDERRQYDCAEANAYRVDIRDNGPLIPWEHLDDIFEEYTSYAGGKDRSGGGLGLAICRMIITLHEGRVWAENTDAGPRFSFVVPVRPAETGRFQNPWRPATENNPSNN